MQGHQDLFTLAARTNAEFSAPRAPAPITLTKGECDARIVQADFAEYHGDDAAALTARIEATIGAKVAKGPGGRGYHPLMASVAAALAT